MQSMSYLFVMATFIMVLGVFPGCNAMAQEKTTTVVFPPLTTTGTACPPWLNGVPSTVLAWNNSDTTKSTNCLTGSEVLGLSLPPMTLTQGQFVMNRALPNCANGQVVTSTGSSFACADPVFTKCSNGSFVLKGSTCPVVPPSCPTIAHAIQACPAGYGNGQIVTSTKTDCDGNVTSLPTTDTCVKVSTFTVVSSQTCVVGQTYYGILNQGVFSPCAKNNTTCKNYICGNNGLQ